ncbi:Nitrogenase FeMo-cofactor synthesis molybdenum delivery protein NifQ [hydrothermal vent metagenome]|uniref:Nitrogenase FeMo-cofactor synthesis molybdenum delivery protein NifQ n=1 Tax=hydrothermal vent metagenome TaxID=652676 RepID=A0A3B1BP10_9ZZZZ
MNTVVSFNETEDVCRQLHAQLMEHSQGQTNDDLLACMLASWSCGLAGLPVFMGLAAEQFQAMLAYHYPGIDARQLLQPQVQLDQERWHERNELRTLLLRDRAGKAESEKWIAEIVATACMAQDHLWQDLGLWSRKDLSRLLQENFPALAARNDRDMKWKKFFYKQLCNAEGIYTCRSPSCEVCADFQECFGPEE